MTRGVERADRLSGSGFRGGGVTVDEIFFCQLTLLVGEAWGFIGKITVTDIRRFLCKGLGRSCSRGKRWFVRYQIVRRDGADDHRGWGRKV